MTDLACKHHQFVCAETECFITEWDDGDMNYGFDNEPDILFNGTKYFQWSTESGYSALLTLTPKQKMLIDKSNEIIKMLNVLDK